jgi:hypothetical protein
MSHVFFVVFQVGNVVAAVGGATDSSTDGVLGDSGEAGETETGEEGETEKVEGLELTLYRYGGVPGRICIGNVPDPNLIPVQWQDEDEPSQLNAASLLALVDPNDDRNTNDMVASFLLELHKEVDMAILQRHDNDSRLAKVEVMFNETVQAYLHHSSGVFPQWRNYDLTFGIDSRYWGLLNEHLVLSRIQRHHRLFNRALMMPPGSKYDISATQVRPDRVLLKIVAPPPPCSFSFLRDDTRKIAHSSYQTAHTVCAHTQYFNSD